MGSQIAKLSPEHRGGQIRCDRPKAGGPIGWQVVCWRHILPRCLCNRLPLLCHAGNTTCEITMSQPTRQLHGQSKSPSTAAAQHRKLSELCHSAATAVRLEGASRRSLVSPAVHVRMFVSLRSRTPAFIFPDSIDSVKVGRDPTCCNWTTQVTLRCRSCLAWPC